MGRGAWWATVDGTTESQAQPSMRVRTHTHTTWKSEMELGLEVITENFQASTREASRNAEGPRDHRAVRDAVGNFPGNQRARFRRTETLISYVSGWLNEEKHRMAFSLSCTGNRMALKSDNERCTKRGTRGKICPPKEVCKGQEPGGRGAAGSHARPAGRVSEAH